MVLTVAYEISNLRERVRIPLSAQKKKCGFSIIRSKILRKQTAILVLNINLLNWHSLTLFSVFILIIKLNFKYEKFFEMFMYGNAFKRYFFYG